MNFFDLHCDTATEAMKIHAGLYGSGLQLDLDRWQGGSLCQSYAVFIPDTLRGEPAWQYFVRCSTYWKEKIPIFRQDTVTHRYKHKVLQYFPYFEEFLVQLKQY